MTFDGNLSMNSGGVNSPRTAPLRASAESAAEPMKNPPPPK